MQKGNKQAGYKWPHTNINNIVMLVGYYKHFKTIPILMSSADRGRHCTIMLQNIVKWEINALVMRLLPMMHACEIEILR